MPAENADFIHQLNADKPTGGESISEGDDHLRAIKTAIKGTFKEVNGPVTSTHTELNAVGNTASELVLLDATVKALVEGVANIDTNSHGNVASCYYNPSLGFGQAGLVYKHNVVDVVAENDGVQTKIIFDNRLDGADTLSHFAFNITPVNATGQATVLTITQTLPTHLAFLAWQLVGSTWTPIPAREAGFSLMVNDMDKSQ